MKFDRTTFSSLPLVEGALTSMTEVKKMTRALLVSGVGEDFAKAADMDEGTPLFFDLKALYHAAAICRTHKGEIVFQASKETIVTTHPENDPKAPEKLEALRNAMSDRAMAYWGQNEHRIDPQTRAYLIADTAIDLNSFGPDEFDATRSADPYASVFPSQGNGEVLYLPLVLVIDFFRRVQYVRRRELGDGREFILFYGRTGRIWLAEDLY